MTWNIITDQTTCIKNIYTTTYSIGHFQNPKPSLQSTSGKVFTTSVPLNTSWQKIAMKKNFKKVQMFVFIVLTKQCLEIKSIFRVTLTSKHTDVFLLCKFHYLGITVSTKKQWWGVHLCCGLDCDSKVNT